MAITVFLESTIISFLLDITIYGEIFSQNF